MRTSSISTIGNLHLQPLERPTEQRDKYQGRLKASVISVPSSCNLLDAFLSVVNATTSKKQSGTHKGANYDVVIWEPTKI
jgi:hypothetical protein